MTCMDQSPINVEFGNHEDQSKVVAEHFFEGAEKLLEISFDACQSDNCKSLRGIPRFELDALLTVAGCRILKCRSGECIDSYVLSESSLFITDTRIILKTCGTTNLLAAVQPLLDLAQRYCSLEQVANAYYSRKNFMRPNAQPDLHGSFEREIACLDGVFEEGAAYCMGSLKQDRWFLYTIQAPEILTSNSDQTLEILMTEMPNDVLSVYNKLECKDAKECFKKCGIEQLLPMGTLIDDELFDPCGYSLNGIIPNSVHYVTIHVTPETAFNFASFETNHNSSCLFQQTLKVLDCFQPDKFIVTLFANDFSARGKDAQQLLCKREMPGYARSNLQFLHLPNETLLYAQYVKKRNHIVKLQRHVALTSHEDDGHSD